MIREIVQKSLINHEEPQSRPPLANNLITPNRRQLFMGVAITGFTLLLLVLLGCTGPAGPRGDIGPAGPQGPPGPIPTGTDTGMKVSLITAKPQNSQYFTEGEKLNVTITLKDNYGNPLTAKDFRTINLYVYGPQEAAKTVTAVKMLNATADRSKPVHHYIDLLQNNSAQYTGPYGNVITYEFQPVTDEEAGTYTVALRVVKNEDPPINQDFILVDFQLKTASVEQQTVRTDNCISCHQGASNGQYYLHHTNPSEIDPYGNPSIDSAPIRTCKACHNNDGYAAYAVPLDSGNLESDQIVHRVHGLHNGENLKNPANTDPATGVFKDYMNVIFPANIENCTTCHSDESWKTKPSKLACVSCHDNVWFDDAKSIPDTFIAHQGGPQRDDSACAVCHTPDAGEGSGVAPVSVVHTTTQPLNKIDVNLTPPENNKFYVAGEKPVVTLVIRDDNGQPIDHTKVDTSGFSTAALFVYGPRENAVPVLSNTAATGISKSSASVTNTVPAAGTPAVWTFKEGDSFKVALNGNSSKELAAPVGAQTPEQVAGWLKSALQDQATVTSSATTVTIRSAVQGKDSRIEIYNSPVTTVMGWKRAGVDIVEGGAVIGKTPGVTVEPYVVVANLSTFSNDMRSDPRAIRGADNINYKLDDVAGLKPGTYMIYTYVVPVVGANPEFTTRSGIGFTTFQVGTDVPDKKVASNCTSCHGNTIWHLDEGPVHPEPFDPDYCLACHDYARTGTGDGFDRVGGTSTSGWSGYGATPLARRVHGLHFGQYLEHPEMIYAGNPSAFIDTKFPQDVRNCTKCHTPETTGTWNTGPSRLACMACHDSASAAAHSLVNTINPVPSDPWNSTKIETCVTCHGEGREFEAEKVHQITDPYQPPPVRRP